MTIRADIPSRGTGPIIATYYIVDMRTGSHMAVSTPDALDDDRFRLVAVPHDVPASEAYLVERAVGAPSLADVVEFARRPQLHSTRTVSPEVAAALEAARRDAEARANG